LGLKACPEQHYTGFSQMNKYRQSCTLGMTIRNDDIYLAW